MSERLLAEGAPQKALLTETARFRLQTEGPSENTLPPFARARFPEIISFPQKEQTVPPQPAPGPPRHATEVFRFLENNLMEIDFAGKVFIKQGTIYSYSGNLTFWVKDRRPGGLPALVIITGTGKVILTDKDREITFMQVDDETVYVEPGHLLACEEGLTPRYVSPGRGLGRPRGARPRGSGNGRALAWRASRSPSPSARGCRSRCPRRPSSPGAATSPPGWWRTPRSTRSCFRSGSARKQLIRLEGNGRVLVEQTSPSL